MARPEGGYPTEEAGVDDILDDPDAHAHRGNPDEYLACITIVGGTTSMILDRLHGGAVHQFHPVMPGLPPGWC